MPATPSVQTVAKLLLPDSDALQNDAHSTNMINDFGLRRCRESAYNYNKLRASIAKVIISGHKFGGSVSFCFATAIYILIV